MSQFDEDILRRNHVALTEALTNFEVICALLEEANIFTRNNSEDVLVNRTRRERACTLLTIVRARFPRAFPCLCHALELTLQFELLEQIDGDGRAREIGRDWGKTTVQVKAQTPDVECKVCHHFERSVILLPCAHLTTCFDCSKRTIECPVCGGKVKTRINGRL
jgi:hypothetical protein